MSRYIIFIMALMLNACAMPSFNKDMKKYSTMRQKIKLDKILVFWKCDSLNKYTETVFLSPTEDEMSSNGKIESNIKLNGLYELRNDGECFERQEKLKSSLGSYKQGQKQGQFFYWSYPSAYNPSLYIVRSETYVKGKQNGWSVTYDTCGKILYKTFFVGGYGYEKNFYYNTNIVYCKGWRINGKRKGKWYFYDKESNLEKIEKYGS